MDNIINSVENDEEQNDELDYEQSDEILLPNKICILPLSERPFFPPQTLPILMNDEIWQPSLAEISSTESRLAGLLLTNGLNPDQAKVSDFETIGALVRVHHPVVASGKIQL